MGVFDGLSARKNILDLLQSIDNLNIIYFENCISIHYPELEILKLEKISFNFYQIHYSNGKSIELNLLSFSDSHVLYLKLQQYIRNFNN